MIEELGSGLDVRDVLISKENKLTFIRELRPIINKLGIDNSLNIPDSVVANMVYLYLDSLYFAKKLTLATKEGRVKW